MPCVKPHCENYAENMPLFRRRISMHFRMRQNTLKYVLDLLRPRLSKQSDKFGREQILLEKHWLHQTLVGKHRIVIKHLYLKYLINETLRCVSDRFNVGKGTVWQSVQRVINTLYAKVETFIKWPNRQESEAAMETIENRYGFPGVIGTHKNYCTKISLRIIHT